jgi:NADPH:quinone reductase-like Zn-dependent oxidoreductase
MKSLYLRNEANSLQLIEQDIPTPQPGSGELLVQVYCAGVTPTELLWYPTLHTKTGDARVRPVPGHEFSGRIAAVGADVDGFSIDDEIYGMNDWFADGATAEYCLAAPSSVAPKPINLSHAEAASVPIGALTAWQGLVDRAKVQSGERVLVQGGAGAVGIFAVQFASGHGAHVSSTASPRNFDFVRQLGAEELIDYNTDYFNQNIQRFDVVFDVVGGSTLERSWSLLKPGGRMVTIAAESEQQIEERVKQAFFIVAPNQQQLQKITALLDSGGLKTAVDTTIPFSQAADAYTGKLAGKRGRGKVIIQVGQAFSPAL